MVMRRLQRRISLKEAVNFPPFLVFPNGKPPLLVLRWAFVPSPNGGKYFRRTYLKK